jgi:NAD(P)-dependent dehydrogenase (short-subunit alcohol dehydrogenase family)
MTARRILITGVSRGLGAALVEEFVARDNIVIGCARTRPAIKALRARYGAPHQFEVVDVGDAAQVAKWAAALVADSAVPDLLLNNAAIINGNADLWEVDPEEFSKVVDVNIKGTFHVIRNFLPAMIERGSGVIVNISSGWGRSTSPRVAPYCATKWAIEGLTQALADELPFGLAAISLNPGVIHTQMLVSCFGESAKEYPSPKTWAKKAAPFLLELGLDDNGDQLTAPV